MNYFLQQLVNGVSLGAVYGLIALGYTMVYGIIGMINFAHGDIYMVGAFISLIFPDAAVRPRDHVAAARARAGPSHHRRDHGALWLDGRARRLSPAARCAAARAADLGHRRVDRAAELRPARARRAREGSAAVDHGLGDPVVVGRVQRHDQRAPDRHRGRDHRADGGLHVAHQGDAVGTRDARDRAGHDHGGARRRRCRPHDLGHVRASARGLPPSRVCW